MANTVGITTITLDTVCVSALANPSTTVDPAEVTALEELIDQFVEGTVRLQLTTAYQRDLERFTDEDGRRQRLEWLRSVPQMEHAAGVFRLDVSVLDGPDTLGSDRDVELDDELRALLEPNRRSAENLDRHIGDTRTLARIMSDIDHQLAHARIGGGWFATLDLGVLGKREQLVDLGIAVALPSFIVTML
jgi:hypothetical protein